MRKNLADELDRIKKEVANEQNEYEAEKPLIIKQEEFMQDCGYKFRYNLVRDTFEYATGEEIWADLKERIVKTIRRKFLISGKFSKRGDSPTVKTLYEIIDTEKGSVEFDPFDQFFTTNKWDGRDRITELLNTVHISDIKLQDFNLKDAWPMLFKRWLIASVACALGQNANHVMLLFISETHGTYKSTWLNNLCPNLLKDYIHFGHIMPNLTEQSTANILAEKFICNIDDQLDTIFIKDFNSIKSIITAPFVTNRKSFRRDDNKRVRRVNFVGSVNNTDIFRDSQNRRYLTFEITKIDWASAKLIDMNQVWLQAHHLYFKDRERHYFDKGDEAMINQINDHYSAISSEHEWFYKLFIPSDKSDMTAKFYPPTEILSIIKKASGLNVFINNLSVAMKRMGLSKTKQKVEWQGSKQARDGYWLIESFKKDFDRISVLESPRSLED